MLVRKKEKQLVIQLALLKIDYENTSWLLTVNRICLHTPMMMKYSSHETWEGVPKFSEYYNRNTENGDHFFFF